MQRLLALLQRDVVGRDWGARRRHLALVRRQGAVHPARPEVPRRRRAVHHQDRLAHPGGAQFAGHPCHASLQCVLSWTATARGAGLSGRVAMASRATSATKLIQRAMRSLALLRGLKLWGLK